MGNFTADQLRVKAVLDLYGAVDPYDAGMKKSEVTW